MNNIESIFAFSTLSSEAFFEFLPLIILSFGAILALILGTDKNKGRSLSFVVSLFAASAALLCLAMTLYYPEINLQVGVVKFNTFSRAIGAMVLIFTIAGIVISKGIDKKEQLASELYALMLFASAGMILMLTTSHLLFMFIALEIMSLPIYVMVAMRRTMQSSAEAGLKYFILGGLASAFFLYGASLIFGATGSFELEAIHSFLINSSNTAFIFYIGSALICVALFFKIGAFPFHSWLPDVYQGAATNVTAFMGAAVKFTAFISFARISQNLLFIEGQAVWFKNIFWIVSAASMIYGNIVAISQTEMKRMLSFSTIAHTGYLLVGLFLITKENLGLETITLYLFFYALSTLGAFAVVAYLEEKNQKGLTLEQITGLNEKNKPMAFMMSVFLLSMAGIPLTSGFIGKYGLFNFAVNEGAVPLVIVAVLTSAISVYYYLRVIIFMYMKPSTKNLEINTSLWGAKLIALVLSIVTIVFGVFPQIAIEFVKRISH